MGTEANIEQRDVDDWGVAGKHEVDEREMGSTGEQANDDAVQRAASRAHVYTTCKETKQTHAIASFYGSLKLFCRA